MLALDIHFLISFVIRLFNSGEWRTQDFRMGGVEVPHAPRVVGSGDGVSPLSSFKYPPPQPLTTGEASLEGRSAPPPENF